MKQILYHFIGLHSILTGLFIFFIPVFLYKSGADGSLISLFISLTGLSFVISLFFFDRMRFKFGILPLIILSFFGEVAIISLLFFQGNIVVLSILMALLYGMYNCLFWTTQRLMFVEASTIKNVGNNFGNIQIIGFILVKIGILIGSYFLESNNNIALLFIVSLIGSYGIYYFVTHGELQKNMLLFSKQPVLPVANIFTFKDKLYSKFIFLLDGLFLFLESFFWLITLYLVSNENYMHLGWLVVVLAIAFSLFFLLIKRKIDNINGSKLFYFAVILYAISWLMRSQIDMITDPHFLYSFILIIAFFSSFFRLIFNKRFFYNSKKTLSHNYILIKSYYSQASIFILFGILYFLFQYDNGNISLVLNILYMVAGGLALGFLYYKQDEKSL